MIQENGGAGASAAAPIARKVLDAYLLDADGKVKAAAGTSPESKAPENKAPEAKAPEAKSAT